MANNKPIGVAYADPVLDEATIVGGIGMFGAPPVTAQYSALTTAAISALTTTGVASLSTAQVSNLTTTQLTTLCANNDLLVTALNKVQTDLNSVRGILGDLGITA